MDFDNSYLVTDRILLGSNRTLSATVGFRLTLAATIEFKLNFVRFRFQATGEMNRFESEQQQMSLNRFGLLVYIPKLIQ